MKVQVPHHDGTFSTCGTNRWPSAKKPYKYRKMSRPRVMSASGLSPRKKVAAAKRFVKDGESLNAMEMMRLLSNAELDSLYSSLRQGSKA